MEGEMQRQAAAPVEPEQGLDGEACSPKGGAVESLAWMADRLLDRLGTDVHRKGLASSTYVTLHLCLYTWTFTAALLLMVFLFACASDKPPPRAGEAMLAIVMVTSSPVLHCFHFTVLSPRHWPGRRGLADAPAPRVRTLLLRHFVAAVLTAAAVDGIRHVLEPLRGGQVPWALVPVVIVTSASYLRGMVQLTQWLSRLGQKARQDERELVRQQLSESALTLADILEATSAVPSEQLAAAVLKKQQIVAFCPEVFGDQVECCICAMGFDASDEISKASCGHYFHSACLGRWFQRSLTCPLCRGKLGEVEGSICQPVAAEPSSEGEPTNPAPVEPVEHRGLAEALGY